MRPGVFRWQVEVKFQSKTKHHIVPPHHHPSFCFHPQHWNRSARSAFVTMMLRLALLCLLPAWTASFTSPSIIAVSSSVYRRESQRGTNWHQLNAVAPPNENVAQTENTSRDKVMTFSYDMSLEPQYDKPTYPGTGNGMSGESGEYDVIVIGSGMGGLSCGAISAKYGDKVLVLESHIKCGGSAHTFSRMHKGGKYSFEVGPSIFEGLDRPSLNPLRMIFDLLDEQMPVKTYTGLGYWTPTGYWRFPIGSQSAFEQLLLEQADDGPKAIAVSHQACTVVVYVLRRERENNDDVFINAFEILTLFVSLHGLFMG
jgi:hypothetical protein